MPRAVGVPSIRCSAKAKSTGERCRRWSLVGSVVCIKHGGAAGQVRRSAQVRLTVQELSRIDPRPITTVLRDAVHLADVTMQDYAQAIVHGDASPATVDRMLESARYTAALAKIALDAGVADVEPEVISYDDAAVALIKVADQLVSALTVGDPDRHAVLTEWSHNALRQLVRGEGAPAVPEAVRVAEPAPGAWGHRSTYPASDRPGASAVASAPTIPDAPDSVIVDAEVVDEPVDVERLEREVASLRRLVPHG